ncbi:TPA: major tail protein [Streptococcus suis]
MTLVGFKSMTIRVLDEEETITEGKNLFTIKGDERKGATQKADIKGLSPEVQKVYGSNIAYYISRKGVGDVTMDTEVIDLPFAVREAILGYVKKGNLGFIGTESEAPYCSVLLESEDLGGTPVLLGFFKGTFSLDDFNVETRKEKPSDPNADKITFTALPGEKGDTDGNYVGYYVGKEESDITKLKNLLGMVAAG